MNLYEIDKAILDCIDQETGELLDEDALRRVMARMPHRSRRAKSA